MTNEQAKQAAIIKAWGKYYERLHPKDKECILRKDGILYTAHITDSIFEEIERDMNFAKNDGPVLLWLFPSSIAGIEDNNGFTRIEPDGSNLPDINDNVSLYEVFVNWKRKQKLVTAYQIYRRWGRTNITHFKKWEPSKPPVY